MNHSEAVEISELLKAKGADSPCPRCGHTHFSVLGDLQLILDSPGNSLLGSGMYKSYVPVAVVGCNKCGFLTSHAISALRERPKGLLG